MVCGPCARRQMPRWPRTTGWQGKAAESQASSTPPASGPGRVVGSNRQQGPPNRVKSRNEGSYSIPAATEASWSASPPSSSTTVSQRTPTSTAASPLARSPRFPSGKLTPLTDRRTACASSEDESALVIRNDPKQCRVCQGAPSRARRLYVSAVTVRYDSAMMASSTVRSILSRSVMYRHPTPVLCTPNCLSCSSYRPTPSGR
jgi:hypothetical protein